MTIKALSKLQLQAENLGDWTLRVVSSELAQVLINKTSYKEVRLENLQNRAKTIVVEPNVTDIFSDCDSCNLEEYLQFVLTASPRIQFCRSNLFGCEALAYWETDAGSVNPTMVFVNPLQQSCFLLSIWNEHSLSLGQILSDESLSDVLEIIVRSMRND